VSASLATSGSLAKPGRTVTYSVWVWSTVPSRQVSANVSSAGHAIDAPKFTLCPVVHRRTCSIGSLPAYQALELMVTDHIGKKAKPGEQISLTVVVQGVTQSPSGGPLSPAEATVSTVLNQASSPTAPSGIGSFPTSAPGLPGTTVTPGSITSLFPVVTPSASPSNHSRQGNRKVTKATSAASSLPLDPRLIGGQLAGLAVLAAAITMVVARLSLRTPQLASATQSGQTAAAAPPPPQPSDADTKTEDAGTETDS
jgi:hypothetical protein